MSIKSQKSLNDECSEIFEKSYSVRSASEESSTCDEDEDSLSRELLMKLTPAVLSKLRRYFKKAKERNGKDVDKRIEEVMRAAAAEEGIEFTATENKTQQETLCLDEKGFVTAFEQIFGHRKYSVHARHLFRSLAMFGGRVWWQQVVGRLVAAGARTTSSRVETWQELLPGGIRKLKHCKRETIVKIVNIEREDSFCYVILTRGGRVGVYSGQMELLNTYEVFYHRTGVSRRVKNCWITDAVYLKDVQHLVISSSDRSLTIYDVVTLSHKPVFCITGLTHIPTCLAYKPFLYPGDESELIFGNERGDLTRMRFLQPRISLLHLKSPDNINYYFWMELSSVPHTTFVSISTWRKVHSRSVRRVMYERDGDIVLSCSHDTTVSVRSRHARGNLDDYVYKVQRGVSCLVVVSPLHLVVTGSPDGVLRLWSTPQGCHFTSLCAPGTGAILDVAVVTSKEIVVAYCNNCNIYIWDLFEECLLQTVKIRFPFLGVLGKKVEFGPYCIHFGPRQYYQREHHVEDDEINVTNDNEGQKNVDNGPRSLLFSCCDHVFLLPLSRDQTSSAPPPDGVLRTRRPSVWEIHDFIEGLSPRPADPKTLQSTNVLTTVTTDSSSDENLEELLEKAGLQGILEKDFVLMRGLKHDLNEKLHKMGAIMKNMHAAVSVGAPHLSLIVYPITHIQRPIYERTFTRFIPESTSNTPSASDLSTPRNCKLKLSHN
ncbi:unnamed protein product [Danaus chrysippus]|uniref:(African queen) hypothetical protein n=1 Tax=Danaus chrysippus TaxID=151541 RepID=A0A8J2QTQ9_9NEOP|nr:unnamed protein product [Danaus chrysippus]